jgi:RecA-family ATPase
LGRKLTTMSTQTVTPVPVKPGKDLLLDELRATIAAKKKKGWSQYKTLEAVRKENAAWEKNGVGLPNDELLALVDAGYKTTRSSRLDCVDEITMQPPEWLWEGRLSRNQLTHFAGESSMGKSPVTLDLIARVTTGSDWPDGTPNTLGPRSVILMASEDDWADTIKPRLKLAGADLRKVFRFVSTISKDDSIVNVSTKLDADLEELKRQIGTLPDVGLIVIDPITNYLGSKSMNKEEDIRSLLMPVSEQIAQALKVCVVTVGHLNKQGKEASTKQRVMGAAAFIGVARNLLMFGADPEETSKKYHHIMGEERNQAVPTLKYHTEMVPVDWEGWEGKKVLRVVWDGISTASIEDSINPDKEEVKAAIELAAQALKLVLQAGRMQANQCKEAVLAGVYKDRPGNFWHRARKKAGVDSKQEGKQWWWFLEAAPSLVEQFDGAQG